MSFPHQLDVQFADARAADAECSRLLDCVEDLASAWDAMADATARLHSALEQSDSRKAQKLAAAAQGGMEVAQLASEDLRGKVSGPFATEAGRGTAMVAQVEGEYAKLLVEYKAGVEKTEKLSRKKSGKLSKALTESGNIVKRLEELRVSGKEDIEAKTREDEKSYEKIVKILTDLTATAFGQEYAIFAKARPGETPSGKPRKSRAKSRS